MKIREQIIKLKEQNKAFKSKRKSLKQWVSYFDQIMETPDTNPFLYDDDDHFIPYSSKKVKNQKELN